MTAKTHPCDICGHLTPNRLSIAVELAAAMLVKGGNSRAIPRQALDMADNLIAEADRTAYGNPGDESTEVPR